MSKKFLWLLGPIFVLALAGCGETDDDDDTDTSSTDDTSTTDGTTDDTEVSLAIGSGSGTSFRSGALSSAIGSAELSAGGETTITASIVDTDNSNALYTGEVITVSFTSGCVEAEKASLSNTSVATSSGTATVTYTAQGCLDDTVVASVSNSSGTASASVGISIATAEVNAISFTGTDFKNSISYSSSSTTSTPSFTTVEFKLYDEYGNAVEGQDVDFSISSSTGDTYGSSLSVDSDTSDENGLVSTIFNAGASADNLSVIASFITTGGESVTTTSPSIAVNSGPADYGSFDFRATEASVAKAFSIGGTTTSVTVRLADHNNNPVADGTIVSFWTEYGYIDPTCSTSNGACTATWTSTSTGTSSDILTPIDGLSTVIAYAIGEDTFWDSSGGTNGVFDITDEFESVPERYQDLNFDGFDATSYTDAGTGKGMASDSYTDYNGNGSYDASSTLFRGTSCSEAASDAGHCAQKSIEIWKSIQLVLNTEEPRINNSLGSPWAVSDNNYPVLISDLNGNYPPFGTTFSLEAIGDADADFDIFGSVPKVGSSEAGSYTFEVRVYSVTTAGKYKIVVTFPGSNPFVLGEVTIN